MGSPDTDGVVIMSQRTTQGGTQQVPERLQFGVGTHMVKLSNSRSSPIEECYAAQISDF